MGFNYAPQSQVLQIDIGRFQFGERSKMRQLIPASTLATLESNPNYWSTKCQTLSEIARNTCMQQPLARLQNLFSVITVILLINMSIPFNLILVRILLPI